MNLQAQPKIVPRSKTHFSVYLLRFWRTAFVFYALLLTIATHWPRLQLGTTESPWPDKLLHMFAFGGLSFLFIRTRFLKNAYLSGLFAAAWTLFDEFSQTLPILDRQASWGDALSGVMGVVLVIAWMWALGAIGGFANRLRLRQQSFLLGKLLSKPRSWLILIASALGGVALIGGIVGLSRFFLFGYLLKVSEQVTGALVAGAVGALAALHIALAGMIRRYALDDNLKASCFVCAASCKDIQLDELGRGKCPNCDAAVFRGQWTEPMQLPISAMLRGAGLAAGVAALLLALRILIVFGFALLHTKFAWAMQMNKAWLSWPADLTLSIDITAIALTVAIAVRIYRSTQAKLYDRQDKFCRACEHDLQGTPIDKGVGRCPECGLWFARFVK